MLGRFSYVADPGQPTLVMTQTFDSPQAEVFEAWTTPEQVSLWWDPTGAPLAICEIDLRTGGAFRWINQGEMGAKYPFAGIYCEIIPPERIVFDALISPSGPKQHITLTFTERDGSTTLTMTVECESVVRRDEMLSAGINAGTERTLQNLANHLQRKSI